MLQRGLEDPDNVEPSQPSPSHHPPPQNLQEVLGEWKVWWLSGYWRGPILSCCKKIWHPVHNEHSTVILKDACIAMLTGKRWNMRCEKASRCSRLSHTTDRCEDFSFALNFSHIQSACVVSRVCWLLNLKSSFLWQRWRWQLLFCSMTIATEYCS